MKKFAGIVGFLMIFMAQAKVWADETTEVPQTPPDQGFWQTFTMIGIALIFFYFILWRPEQKRRKQMEETRGALKSGDRVTAMGIVGTVVKIQDQTIILKMYDGSKIEVLKAAITEVMPGVSEESPKKADEEPNS